MSKQILRYRFQKCSDVDRELAIFEVLDDRGTTIMDISMNDDSKRIEVFFHDGIAKTSMTVTLLQEIVDEGVRLLAVEA